jgi:hypothetical protein
MRTSSTGAATVFDKVGLDHGQVVFVIVCAVIDVLRMLWRPGPVGGGQQKIGVQAGRGEPKLAEFVILLIRVKCGISA